jgi:hypothetical protein
MSNYSLIRLQDRNSITTKCIILFSLVSNTINKIQNPKVLLMLLPNGSLYQYFLSLQHKAIDFIGMAGTYLQAFLPSWPVCGIFATVD